MNTKLKSIKLCVHGVNIKCSTNNPEFLKYIKDHMYFFLADTSINSDIETNIIFNKENRIRSLAGLEKLGVNLYQDKEKLVYIEKNLDLEASYLDGLMVIDSQVDKNSGLKESLKKVLKFLFRRRVEKNHEFFMLLRRLIIFPVFYFMENFKEIYQMHASAFVLENKTVVIAGLANVGKSTSSLAATLDL